MIPLSITILLIVLAFVLLVIGYLLFENFFIYRHIVILKDATERGASSTITRAKERKDKKKNVTVWVLKKGRKEIPFPPIEARQSKAWGGFIVEAWEMPDGQVYYETHPEFKQNYVMTSNQKSFLTEQIQKANDRRNMSLKDLLLQFGLPVTFAVLMLITFITGAVLYKDIAEPIIEAKTLEKETQGLLNQNLIVLQELRKDVQILQQNEAQDETAPN